LAPVTFFVGFPPTLQKFSPSSVYWKRGKKRHLRRRTSKTGDINMKINKVYLVQYKLRDWLTAWGRWSMIDDEYESANRSGIIVGMCIVLCAVLILLVSIVQALSKMM
jgi:hypothetical protein